MRKPQDEKLIYKMYKKGRFWVFAGIAVTTWNVNLLAGQAATTTDQDAAVSSSTTASAASQLSGSTTTLSQSSSSVETPTTTDETSTATSKADQTTTESTASTDSETQTENKDTSTTGNESGSKTADSQDASKTSATQKETDQTSEASQSSSTKTDQSSTSHVDQTSTDNQSTNVSDDQSTTTNQVTDTTSSVNESTTPAVDQSTTTPATDAATPEVNAVETGNDVTSAENANLMTVNDLASANVATNTLTTALGAAAVQGTVSKKMLARAAAITATTSIVASGDFSKEVAGGSTWTLDSTGLLTVSAGAWGQIWGGSNSWYKNMSLIKSVKIEGPVTIANNSLTRAFYNATNLSTIEGFQNIETANVTNMSLMFSGAIISDFSGIANWDTSKVTNMSGIFSSTVATNIPVADWDVSSVTSFDRMFQNNTALASMDLSGWTLNATNEITMGGMFLGDTSLTNLDLSGWNTTNVTSVVNLFASDSALTSLNLTGWKITKADSWMNTFKNTSSLTSVDLSGWKSDIVTDLTYTFSNTGILNGLNMAQFNTSKVTSMQGTFAGTDLTGIDLSSWTTNDVNDMSYLFDGATLAGMDVSIFNTDNVTNMSYMFRGTDLSGVKLPKNTSAVTDMSYMFANTKPASVNLSTFDTSKVANMTGLFSGSQLATIDLSYLDTSNVTLMSNMFANTRFTSLDFSKFNTANVTDMSNMFANSKVTSLDLSTFDMSNVTGLPNMFNNATDLSTLTLSDTAVLIFTTINIFGEKATDTVGLPNVPKTGSYTGLWVDTNGKTYTSVDLMNAYEKDTTTGKVPDVTTAMTYTWQVITSKSEITSKDVTLIAGPSTTWTPKDSVATLKDVDGNAIDLSTIADDAITYSGETVKPDVADTYNITLSYTDDKGITRTVDATVTVNDSKAVLVGKQVSVNQGSTTWQASDSVNQALSLDANGNVLSAAELATVTGTTLDTSKSGLQTVTLTYTDVAGNIRTTDVNVNVIASQAGLVTKDVTIAKGPNATWNILDNIVSGTDFNGDAVTDLTTLKVTTDKTPDLTTAGTTAITLTYTDSEGNTHEYTVNVNVVASQASLVTKDVTIVKGSNVTWNVLANIVSATDFNGDAVTDLTTLKVTTDKTPDLTTVGTYPITLTYTDSEGNTYTYNVNVNVTANQATLTGKDTTIVMGPNASWQVSDNVVSGQDADGNALSAEKLATVTADKTPDLTKPGDTVLTLTYTDAAGNIATTTATVHVVQSAADVQVKDATIVMGPNATWQAKDNLIAVIQANGDTVAADDVVLENNVKLVNSRVMSIMYSYLRADGTTVTVSGNVDLQKVGDYAITYTYTDAQGNTKTATANVSVIASQADLQADNQTIISGPNATWQAGQTITSIKDADGNALTASDVTVTGDTVDVMKPGTYQVTYQYTDRAGNHYSKTITVTVVATQANVDAKDSEIKTGTTWNAADNFVSATDETGKTLTLDQVTVTGNVDPTKAGTYTVTYQYTDAVGNVKTATATITVTDPVVDPGKPENPGDDGNTVNPGTPDGGGNTDNGDQGSDGDTINPGQPGTNGNDQTGNTTGNGTSTPTSDGTTDSQAAHIQPTATAGAAVTASAKPAIAVTKLNQATGQSSTATSPAKLPQTSDQQTENATALGLVLLALTGVTSWLGLGRKRRHN